MMRQLAAAAITSMLISGGAAAQDLQDKGVGYYGGAAAKRLYTQPVMVRDPRRMQQQRMPLSAARQTVRDYSITINSGGYPRRVLVHLPPNYTANIPVPVILAFHGLHMNGQMMMALTLLNFSADKYGFAVLYPDAIGGHWNDGFQADQVDDVRFVRDLLSPDYKVGNFDRNAVYACGISNGGMFAERLASDASNMVRAIAVVAATGYTAVCSRGSGAMPAAFFLGTEDSLVPRDGETKALGKLGEAVGLSDLGIDSIKGDLAKYAGVLTANDVVDCWTRRNGCSTSPRTMNLPDRIPNDKCRVRLENYGSGRSEVAVYTLEGGGHTWPGGMPVAAGVLGRTTGDINASQIICEFFRSH